MERKIFLSGEFPKFISGIGESSLAYFISNLTEKQILVILPDEEDAYSLVSDINTFINTISKKENENLVEAVLFPALDKIADLPVSPEIIGERLKVIIDLSKNNNVIVITTAKAIEEQDLIKASGELFNTGSLVEIKIGDNLDILKFTDRIIKSDYEREYLVSEKGKWAMLGGIIDIYPRELDYPIRIELEGDKVFSIRSFDCFTQRTEKMFSAVEIFIGDALTGPSAEVLAEDRSNYFNLIDYFSDKLILIHEQAKDITSKKHNKVIYTSALNRCPEDSENITISVSSTTSFSGNINLLKTELKKLLNAGFEIVFFSFNEGEKTRLIEIFNEIGIFDEIKINNKIRFEIGVLSSGFINNDEKLAVFSENEIFSRYTTRIKTVKSKTTKHKKIIKSAEFKISDIVDMKYGDFVVHSDYGIARFLGVSTIEIDGGCRDFLTLKYDGGDKLHIPLNKINVVSKYIADKEPVLDKLYSFKWQKAKDRIKEKTRLIAKELVEIAAAREVLSGYSFSADTHWQNEFESEFIYEETDDQINAIAEVKKDMENNKPMDRLLCGDVGYGKTEVAMRASFKAVMDKKQVAVLAPTTILAEQHYNTFRERMADYPINIDMLSRFRTEKEQKKILSDMQKGLLDIVIGTHRLLQKDIKFLDLGLIVVDEEQRFGVKAKETLKQIKKTVDVLTLTATPIPRTLHTALSGIKKISVINTPPEGRIPIETYCFTYNEKTIKEAIEREIKRNGQVFYLYNRIEDIEKKREKLRSLVNDAKICIGHGRMEGLHLERVMKKFINREYNILLSTTIIENGLDMPNVNTIIIENAHTLGLSELYQLRGRVGRSLRKAYAYITYPEYSGLSTTAIERLKAISECSSLGAGFKIALKDLEIRGAGNIIGPEQHGYIAKIGFDLYTQLLAEAVISELEQNDSELRQDGSERSLDRSKEEEPEISLKIDAYIPESYITNDIQKINTYRKLSVINDDEGLLELKDEIIDIYGKMPIEVQNLFDLVKIKIKAKKIKIKSIKEADKNIVIEYSSNKKSTVPIVPQEKIFSLILYLEKQ